MVVLEERLAPALVLAPVPALDLLPVQVPGLIPALALELDLDLLPDPLDLQLAPVLLQVLSQSTNPVLSKSLLPPEYL